MIELRSAANDRQHCGRSAPQVILKRVAGIAFNFSSIDLNPARTGKTPPDPAQPASVTVLADSNAAAV